MTDELDAENAALALGEATTEAGAEPARGRVHLKPRKSRPFFGRHPWVLETAIASVEGQPADGDVVDLCSEKGKFIARGLYNSQSRLRVRLYSWQPGEALDAAFWQGRLTQALALRKQLGYDDPQGAARLVFSEADGLSGIIVDRYADYLAVQFTARAMAQRLDEWCAWLSEAVRPRGIVLRQERGIAQAEGLSVPEGFFHGTLPDGPVFVNEHGLRYGIDLREGQKTGYYLDQRENRRAAAGYMRGRRVVDVCCYSGGFSLCASVLGKAQEVLALDTSAKAIALGRANAQLNGVSNIQWFEDDCFLALNSLKNSGERFGAVVLDPPKFARSRRAVDEALRAYHQLNRLAVEVLEPGGILVTCSCSGHVTREDFCYLLAGVSQQTRRDLQILEQRGAAPDHPVSSTCLETEYLKCFICRVGT